MHFGLPILTYKSVNFLRKGATGTTDECWKWHRAGENALQTNWNLARHTTAGILWCHRDIPLEKHLPIHILPTRGNTIAVQQLSARECFAIHHLTTRGKLLLFTCNQGYSLSDFFFRLNNLVCAHMHENIIHSVLHFIIIKCEMNEALKQLTGLDACASRVKCPARFASHYNILADLLSHASGRYEIAREYAQCI